MRVGRYDCGQSATFNVRGKTGSFKSSPVRWMPLGRASTARRIARDGASPSSGATHALGCGRTARQIVRGDCDENAADDWGRLASSLLHLGATLADLEFRIALADHVHTTAAFDDLAVGVTVLQCSNAADNFHGTLSSGDALVGALLIFVVLRIPFSEPARRLFAVRVAEYTDPFG